MSVNFPPAPAYSSGDIARQMTQGLEKPPESAAGEPQLAALSEVQLQELLTQLVTTNAALAAFSDENGATAISLPSLASSTDMGALSTADLLQLIRAEVAKTTALLLSATAEAITAQQATIELKGKENTGKIEQSIQKEKEAAEKAEKMKALNLALKIFGGLAIGIMLVMGAVTGGATAVIAVAMLAMFVTMTCLTEKLPGQDETGMDKMGKSCAKTFYSHLSPEEAEKKGAELAGGIMMAIQAVVCICCIVGAASSAAGKIADVAIKGLANSANAAIKTVAVQIAPRAAQAGAAVQVVQGATGIAAGVVALDVAETQYDASMAQAEVTKLKALIQMLEQILEGDTEFIQMLMELQAKLDSFVAGVVADEHTSSEQTDLHSGAMA